MRHPEASFPVVFLDGAYVPAAEARVSVFDRGLLVADGVFDTLLCLEGAPLSLDAHLERLAGSAAFMWLEIPGGPPRLRRVIEELLARNGVVGRGAPPAAVRVTITRGAALDGPPTVLVTARRVAAEHLEKRRRGVSLYRLPLRGRGSQELAEHKTLSHLPSALGQVLLARMSTGPRSEGLFVSSAGDALEGTASNLFVVEGASVVTPPIAAGILRGTARHRALEVASSCGLDVREERVPLERLASASEAFITSSTLRVAPAVALDDQPIGVGGPGPVTRRLQAACDQRVEAEIEAWHLHRH